jgi:hypothetical protein
MTDQQPATLPHDLVGEIRPDKDTNTIPPRACRGSWLSGAPAFGQERRSADFIVPLGYCKLTSTPSLKSSATYTANQREGASPPLARS